MKLNYDDYTLSHNQGREDDGADASDERNKKSNFLSDGSKPTPSFLFPLYLKKGYIF